MPNSPKSYVENRPWGSFERFTTNEPSTVKIITVNPGQAFSLQTHTHRDEWWKIVEGSGTVILGQVETPAKKGDSFFIPRGTAHRMTAGAAAVVFLEISFGDFNENDITRLSDRYGRT
jgi:mannose-6-phosphate isomerase-like protein (cupin superfamily)